MLIGMRGASRRPIRLPRTASTKSRSRSCDLAGVSGLREARPHEMLVLLDREPVQTFSVSRATIGDEVLNEKALKARITVKAGPHNLAVTFVRRAHR